MESAERYSSPSILSQKAHQEVLLDTCPRKVLDTVEGGARKIRTNHSSKASNKYFGILIELNQSWSCASKETTPKC